MSEAFQIMLWPLLACLLLPGVLVYLGLHIVRRGIIFVDLALAQVAALGICVAILIGHDSHDWQTTAWSAGFTLIGAAVLTMTRPQVRGVPQEAWIGIVYVVAAAAAFLLLSRSPEGNEELRRTLVGEILLVTPGEVLRTFGVFVAVGAVLAALRNRFFMLLADAGGGRPGARFLWVWDFLFYILFGIVVTTFVRMSGVLLTFSYLIIPAVCGNLFAGTFRWQLVIGWLLATLSGLVGLYGSYQLDLPTGAAIVCALGLVLVLAAACVWLIRKKNPPASVDPGD